MVHDLANCFQWLIAAQCTSSHCTPAANLYGEKVFAKSFSPAKNILLGMRIYIGLRTTAARLQIAGMT
jgi:hypothetical protein